MRKVEDTVREVLTDFILAKKDIHFYSSACNYLTTGDIII